MFKNIQRFSNSSYFKVVEFFTTCLMSWTFKMMYYLLALKSNDAKYINSLATRFALITAGMMRQKIILSGKDPDYVAPPPPPIETEPVRKTFIGSPYQPLWVGKSFKDKREPSKLHPVITSRLVLEGEPSIKRRK